MRERTIHFDLDFTKNNYEKVNIMLLVQSRRLTEMQVDWKLLQFDRNRNFLLPTFLSTHFKLSQTVLVIFGHSFFCPTAFCQCVKNILSILFSRNLSVTCPKMQKLSFQLLPSFFPDANNSFEQKAKLWTSCWTRELLLQSSVSSLLIEKSIRSDPNKT